MKKIAFLTIFLSILYGPFICVAQSSRLEILDYHIAAFNQRDVDKFLVHLHDSVRIMNFPDKISQSNIDEVRATYTSAFNAQSLSGQMRVVGRKEFGDSIIQEEWLEGYNIEPVMNYVMYRFVENEIIEVVYLPKNWKPSH